MGSTLHAWPTESMHEVQKGPQLLGQNGANRLFLRQKLMCSTVNLQLPRVGAAQSASDSGWGGAELVSCAHFSLSPPESEKLKNVGLEEEGRVWATGSQGRL